jgi:inner membrane protein
LLSLLAASATFRHFHTRWLPLTGVLFVVIASHGVLDAFTKGGMDIPFFWPLGARYGNWGPIPVADLGFELPDPRYSRSLRSELLWVWLPTVALVGATMARRRLRHRKALSREISPGCGQNGSGGRK